MPEITLNTFDHHSSFNKCLKEITETTTFLLVDGAVDFSAKEMMSLKKESEFINNCYKNKRTSFINLTSLPIKSAAFSLFNKTITKQNVPKNLDDVLDILNANTSFCTIPSAIESYLMKSLETSTINSKTFQVYFEIANRLVNASLSLREAMSQFFCTALFYCNDKSSIQRICVKTILKMRPQKLSVVMPANFLISSLLNPFFFWLVQCKLPHVMWKIEVSDQRNENLVEDKNVEELLTKCSRISNLSITSNRITDKSLILVANHPHLKEVCLKTSSKIGEEAALKISQNPRLERLSLINWQLLSDKAAGSLAKAPFVKSLSLSNCKGLSERSLQKLAASRIFYWDLKGAVLTDPVLGSLAENTSLQILKLQNQTTLSNSEILKLVKTPLFSLDLSGCLQLDKKTVQALLNHLTLQVLFTKECKVFPSQNMQEGFTGPQWFV